MDQFDKRIIYSSAIKLIRGGRYSVEGRDFICMVYCEIKVMVER